MSEINTIRPWADHKSRPGSFRDEGDRLRERPAESAAPSGGLKDATESLIEEAGRIAAEIASRAIPGPDGGVTWADCGADTVTGEPRSVAEGETFFDGRCGVAYFLAALYAVTGTERLKEIALEAIKGLGNTLRSGRRLSLGFELPPGIGFGVGGLVYGLTRISHWLDEPGILEEACLAGEIISREHIERDQEFDVLRGSAGAILGLLSLWNATSQRRWLVRAGWCARHLLRHREISDGHAAWVTCVGCRHLTGYSHGAAGIAHALLMLFKQCGDPELLSAAREAIAYESSVYCADVSNWPDFRPAPAGAPDRRFANSWCNGAPGIGLSRTAALGLGMDAEIVRDIENAAACVMATPPTGADNLCCGTMGQVEFLTSAGFCLDRRDLVIAGLQRAARVRRRRDRRGFYQVRASADGAASPVFLQGLSGIGYQFLRIAYPAQYPRVLLWE